MSHTVK